MIINSFENYFPFLKIYLFVEKKSEQGYARSEKICNCNLMKKFNVKKMNFERGKLK